MEWIQRWCLDKRNQCKNYIQKNYTLYEGDDSFLADVSQKTKKVWNKCEELLAEELKKEAF